MEVVADLIYTLIGGTDKRKGADYRVCTEWMVDYLLTI